MIGNRIKELRQLQGLSAQALSNKVGGLLTRSVIANLETGRKQDLMVTELVAIAGALNVPPEQIDPRLGSTSSHWHAGYQQALRDVRARIADLSG